MGVAIAFWLSVLTAQTIQGAPLEGLLGSDDVTVTDVSSVIDVVGNGGKGLTALPAEYVLKGVTGGDADLDSTVDSVAGSDDLTDSLVGGGDLNCAADSVTENDDLTDLLAEDTVETALEGVTDGDVDTTVESVTGSDDLTDLFAGDAIQSPLGGITKDEDLDCAVDSVMESDDLTDIFAGGTTESASGGTTKDEELDCTVDSVTGSDDLKDLVAEDTVETGLGGVTGDADLDSAVDSVTGSDDFTDLLVGDNAESILGDIENGDLDGILESILGGVTGDENLDSIVDSVLGNDELTDLLLGDTEESVFEVTDEVGDLTSADSVLEGVTDESDDALLSKVTDNVNCLVGPAEPVLEVVIGQSGSEPVGDVVNIGEPVLETIVSSDGVEISEVIYPSEGIVKETSSTVDDVAVGKTTCATDPRVVKVLVPVLKKLMTNKSTLGTLVKLAMAARLKKAAVQTC